MKNLVSGKWLVVSGLIIMLIGCASAPKQQAVVAPELTAEQTAEKEAELYKTNIAAELAKIDTMLFADSPNATAAHEHYLRALDMMEDGKIMFAELFYKRALAYEPTSHFLLSELIKILLRQNKTEEAFPLLQLSVQSPKATGDDFLFMARIYKEKEMLDSSAAYYKKAVDRIKGNFSIVYEYSKLLEVIQDFPELKRMYDILLPEIDYPPRLLEKQIIIYRITDTPDSALADLLGAAFNANGINYAEYGVMQAQILGSLKKYNEANEVLLAIYFMHPSKELTSKLALNIAHNYELMDSITVAVMWLEQLLKTEPENHIALNNLGYMLIDRNLDINRGIELVDKALTYSPDELSYLDSKAWGLYKTGKHQEALEILEKLAASGMDANELWEHLVAVCEALKLEDKVKEYKARIK